MEPGAAPDWLEDPIEAYHAWVNPEWLETLDGLGILREFVWAEGCRLRDADGATFLDLVGGFGSTILGHNPPALLKRLHAALDNPAPGIVPWGFNADAGLVAERLCRLAAPHLAKAHFANSGAEAVDSALKFAAAHTGRTRFIASRGGFHGTTIAATGLAIDGPWRKPFPDIWPATDHVAANDLAGLADLLADEAAAAVILEVVQATGGGVVWTPDALQGAGALCRHHGAVLILDETLTALGRTGDWFAFHAVGSAFEPDMVIVGKAISGGLVPVSAVLMTDSVYDATFRNGRPKVHGGTYAGSRLPMACALAVLDLLERGDTLAEVRSKEAYLRSALQPLRAAGLIGEVRGRGLAIGVQILRCGAGDCCLALMGQGVLTNLAAHAPDILKLTPPLTLTTEDIDIFVQALTEVLSD